VFYFAIEFLLVDVSIAAFTPIMIAAATGALVSERLSWTKLFEFQAATSFGLP
jgi:CIC family chloride channel protein